MTRTILFITSNGAGLGHLTRVMAVARRLDPEIRPVLFTLSQGAPIAVQQGFFVEYMTSAEHIAKGSPGLVTRTRWNALLRDRLIELLEIYNPGVVLFDGTHPYNGLIAAIKSSPARHWIWFRRGMWRAGLGRSSLARARYFSEVIEPGDVAAEADTGPTARLSCGVTRVPPIYYMDPEELMGRREAEEALGLDPSRLHAFVQLGAGNINDISSVAAKCTKKLLSDRGVEVVFADSAISEKPLELWEKLVRVGDYPATRYARAFDLAVGAAGYNTFHELIRYGVPSLFVPNTRTKLDDQSARARYAEMRGLGLSWEEDGVRCLDAQIEGILDAGIRSEIGDRLGSLHLPNGARDVARRLEDLLRGRGCHP